MVHAGWARARLQGGPSPWWHLPAQCRHGRMSCQDWLPAVSMPIAWAAVASWLSRNFKRQVGLTQAPIKLLLLPCNPEHVRFSMHPLRVDCLSPPALWDYWSKPCLLFKPNALWGLILPVQDLWAGEPDLGLGTLFGELCNYNSPVCGSPTWGYGTWLYSNCALLPIWLWFLLNIFCHGGSFGQFWSFQSVNFGS